ncbi:hypothetical protein [Streptomyces chartreusis]
MTACGYSLSTPHGENAIIATYSVPDDAWYLELDLVAGQRNLVTAVVPDEDPALELTVRFNPRAQHTDVPYEVMRWFMHQVDEETRTSRAWMQPRPELIEIIYQLRHEHMGVINDDILPTLWRKSAPRSPRQISPPSSRPPSDEILTPPP